MLLSVTCSQVMKPVVSKCMLTKLHPDPLQAQPNPYRRVSANLDERKHPGKDYHIHGSLEAVTTLNMVGLEGRRPYVTNYDKSDR